MANRDSLSNGVAATALLIFAWGPSVALAGNVDAVAKTLSADIREPVRPAAVAGIPAGASGSTGYESAPRNWPEMPASSPLKGKRVALTVMGLGQPYFLAICLWERLAAHYGFELKVYDGRFDAVTVQQRFDDTVSDKPGAVAFDPLDSAAAAPQMRRMPPTPLIG